MRKFDVNVGSENTLRFQIHLALYGRGLVISCVGAIPVSYVGVHMDVTQRSFQERAYSVTSQGTAAKEITEILTMSFGYKPKDSHGLAKGHSLDFKDRYQSKRALSTCRENSALNIVQKHIYLIPHDTRCNRCSKIRTYCVSMPTTLRF